MIAKRVDRSRRARRLHLPTPLHLSPWMIQPLEQLPILCEKRQAC